MAPTHRQMRSLKLMHDETEPDDLISIAAAAKEVGVNRSTLSRQVNSGEIRSHNGKVRLSEVLSDRIKNIDLTRSKRRAGKLDDVARDVASNTDATKVDATASHRDEDRQDDWVEVDGKPVPYREARRLKEIALARLRQLEFDQKSGQVCSIEAVTRHVVGEYSVVRERLLAMPGQIASPLYGCDRHEIEALLRAKINEILENLSDPAHVAEVGRMAAMN